MTDERLEAVKNQLNRYKVNRIASKPYVYDTHDNKEPHTKLVEFDNEVDAHMTAQAWNALVVLKTAETSLWKSIETVPEHKHVLTYRPFIPDRLWTPGCYIDIYVAGWVHAPRGHQPTHWMELPDPPAGHDTAGHDADLFISRT